MDRSQKRIRPITKAEDLVQVAILRPMMGFYLSEVSWEGISIMENRICTVGVLSLASLTEVRSCKRKELFICLQIVEKKKTPSYT